MGFKKESFFSVGNFIFFCGLMLIGFGFQAQDKNLTVDLGRGIKMEFVFIPSGSFLMGSEKESRFLTNAKPTHKVTIPRPFYIGKYEVTQEQWQVLMGVNPSSSLGLKKPVDQVSWFACQGFLVQLRSRVSGLLPRLPTEAEWEYACRAGSTTEYGYGDSENDLGTYGWAGNWEGSTHPVGGKKPNAWDLYDMHGNVLEWCSDWFEEEYYAHSPENDPRGPDAGEHRVQRGGSAFLSAELCYSAWRLGEDPIYSEQGFGFRVVLEIK